MIGNYSFGTPGLIGIPENFQSYPRDLRDCYRVPGDFPSQIYLWLGWKAKTQFAGIDKKRFLFLRNSVTQNIPRALQPCFSFHVSICSNLAPFLTLNFRSSRDEDGFMQRERGSWL